MNGIKESLPVVLLLTSWCLTASAASQINDPVNFVTGVYQRYVEAQKTNHSYSPPADIFTPRLEKLFQDDRRRAKGEVGCLDFDFWVNGQDWTIANLTITNGGGDRDRTVVVARFLNLGEASELHFDFRRISGRWLLDDVHSVKNPSWTLSDILKCGH
jgi:hypothetical protein